MWILYSIERTKTTIPSKGPCTRECILQTEKQNINKLLTKVGSIQQIHPQIEKKYIF